MNFLKHRNIPMVICEVSASKTLSRYRYKDVEIGIYTKYNPYKIMTEEAGDKVKFVEGERDSGGLV